MLTLIWIMYSSFYPYQSLTTITSLSLSPFSHPSFCQCLFRFYFGPYTKSEYLNFQCVFISTGLWRSFWSSQGKEEWWTEPVFIILSGSEPMASLQGRCAPTTVSLTAGACAFHTLCIHSLQESILVHFFRFSFVIFDSLPQNLFAVKWRGIIRIWF